jgi:hypothetical protein
MGREKWRGLDLEFGNCGDSEGKGTVGDIQCGGTDRQCGAFAFERIGKCNLERNAFGR